MVNFFIYLTFLTGLITTTVLAETVTAKENRSCLNSKMSGKGRTILLTPGFVNKHRVWNDFSKILSKNIKYTTCPLLDSVQYLLVKNQTILFKKIKLNHSLSNNHD